MFSQVISPQRHRESQSLHGANRSSGDSSEVLRGFASRQDHVDVGFHLMKLLAKSRGHHCWRPRTPLPKETGEYLTKLYSSGKFCQEKVSEQKAKSTGPSHQVSKQRRRPKGRLLPWRSHHQVVSPSLWVGSTPSLRREVVDNNSVHSYRFALQA